MTGVALFFMIFGFAFLTGGLYWTVQNMIKHTREKEKEKEKTD